MDAEQAQNAVFTVRRMSPAGEELSTLTLSARKMDNRVRYGLLKEAVVMYAANRRQGTHDTKTRSRIAGSQRKLWRQKGTGRARPGTRKNPLWRGGGVVFGPHPRDYSYAINRKQRRLALLSALYARFRSGQVMVLEGLELDVPRTRTVADALRALGVEGRCLIGTAEPDRCLVLSARNIPGVRVLPVRDFNAEEVLLAKYLILTPDAFEALKAAPDRDPEAGREGEDSTEGQD